MKIRLARTTLSILILLLVSGCAIFPRNQFRPVEKGDHWRVRLVKYESGSDVVTKGGFQHPYEFTLLKLNRILGSIYYQDTDVLGNPQKHQVFTSRVRALLLKPLQKAFSMAKPDEVVDFSFMLKEQMLVIFTNDFFTSGIMFIKDNQLNVVFRTINFKGMDYPDALRQFVGDPTNRPIPEMWTLVPGPGQRLKKAPKSSFSFFQQPYFQNWLIIDLNYEFKPAPLKARRRHRPKPVEEVLTPEGQAPKIRIERPSNPSSSIYRRSPSVSTIDDPEVRRKLNILRQLYNSGEISRATYERKKEELLAPK